MTDIDLPPEGFDYWEEHDLIPLSDWLYAANEGDTRRSYWAFVNDALDLKEAEWEEHDLIPLSDWIHSANEGDTRRSYGAFVNAALDLEETEDEAGNSLQMKAYGENDKA